MVREHAGEVRPTTAMSIDVEEWFQVENLRRVIPRHSWDDQERRLERTMERMLALLADADVRATCFVLGWVAERSPRLVQRIADAGHEVACHGHGHVLLPELGPDRFRDDAERSKRALEDITGRPVVGYRAPSFSLTDWALPILGELGFEYDSSYFPITFRHGRYGRPETVRDGLGRAGEASGVTEVSLSCLRVRGYAVPWAGGGYFRLLPYRVFRRGVHRIVRSGTPYIFYIHPWELDPEQPRVRGLRRLERLRHYLNLERAEARWSALLRDFEWVPVRDLVSSEGTRASAPTRESASSSVGEATTAVEIPR